MSMMKLLKNEDAFTGLEAAIVLIAFVVVAAVFSYVMLGAGFFTAQESQRVVHTGTEQASSSLEIIGNVYGYATTAGAGNLDSIVFTVGNTAGGSPIDVSQMLVTYVCEGVSKVIEYDSTNSIVKDATTTTEVTIANEKWGVIETYNDVGGRNKLLEPGEQFVLKIMVPSPGINKQFSINLQPSVGAVYPIKRTVPPNLDLVNILR